MELEAQRKDEERKEDEEDTEEPKGFTTQETARGFSLLVEAWLVFEAAATAAKSLQSCPTLCDPIDGNPPGSPIPGVLQARTLEWVASSFEAPDLNVERRMKVAAVVQNAIQGYRGIPDKRDELPPRNHWIIFSRG